MFIMYIKTEKAKLQDNVILKSTTRTQVHTHTNKFAKQKAWKDTHKISILATSGE